MEDKLSRLKSILGEIQDLEYASSILDWDKQTNMPKGGSEDRAFQLGTLSAIRHEKSTSTELGQLLDDLQSPAASLDPDSDDARLVKRAARDFQKRTRVPADLVVNFTRARAVSHHTWVQARAENNFALFLPHLEKILGFRRQYAECFAPYDHIYDPLLDDYEPGMKTAEVRQIFAALKPQQVELIRAISSRPQVDNSFLSLDFDLQKQWDFAYAVIQDLGLDLNRSRQDTSAHPFTTAFGLGDVRITTRMIPDWWPGGFFASVHETGHALYDLGFDQAYRRTPLADGASMAVHESQSRMWENLVGRSRDFWIHYYPRLQETFPAQLGNLSLDNFYLGINKVEPSPIRIEADEATYNLHIMLRFDLELALVEGTLEPRHLPEAWNETLRAYLGITPANDSQGVLQDVHWSDGSFGYFSTYALGNLVSGQLWEKILEQNPDLPEQIRGGQFSGLQEWLHENIHRYGAKYEPQELIQHVTGAKINPGPYMRYLTRKFGEIYGM